ncbi:MAG: DNA polymerase III subunit chi [Pseudomonadota bacterium]
MTKCADFYLIPANTVTEQWKTACRLLAKAFEQKQDAYVHVSDAEAAQQFNELLWTFRDISFVPHQLALESTEIDAPIKIGYQTPTADEHNILVNLTDTIPDFAAIFDRIIEIIPQEKTAEINARKRYKIYQQNGRDLHTHDLRK